MLQYLLVLLFYLLVIMMRFNYLSFMRRFLYLLLLWENYFYIWKFLLNLLLYLL